MSQEPAWAKHPEPRRTDGVMELPLERNRVAEATIEILWDSTGETPVQLILGQRRFNLVEE